ncbi:MAG: AAA family ATPase [Pseudomonadota bacterium]
MISKVAIAGYRSLRKIVLPLGQLTVVTGGNGTGKSSIYRSLRLLADIADDRAIRSLAMEGGFESIRWAGPETISREMRSGDAPIQGTVRKGPVALQLGFQDDDLSYSIELGLPTNVMSLFSGDPEIKRELIWHGDKPSPSKIIADRRGPGIRARNDHHEMVQLETALPAYDSMVRHVSGPDAPWELAHLRKRLAGWRFYDHIRTDQDASARRPQIGTRTLSLSPTGEDVAAAVQTIHEIGDTEALNSAINKAFPGAQLGVVTEGGLFRLVMQQEGMLRPLGAAELSDGTLRFVLLATALLTPRPPPLMVLNEPESSLHSSLMPALAGLISRAAEDSQIIVVSHNRSLVTSLMGCDAELVELYKDTGETFAQTSETPTWSWPKR